ncbi:carnitine dehydratase [Williamsia sp. 1138]|uniref:CaiB/BaiF CoA transferase family protein n=1 Tax=Williamsia sp. 1138 TaxID=1903117 RepID=UPI000A11897C|nr:CaiB/BaiF CoA-transferase family protein [Williamsia sp. 1138]OZG29313.1 carnitine dehydratase [Williamsia sp. 1138]
MTSAQPLAGITVVSLEHAVAVPFATRQLADLGARVIKIERPGVGDFARGYDRSVHGQSSYFVWLNRGKESLELDVKNADDRRVLDVLIERADVFVSNLGPGAIDRLGLDARTLRESHPDLVHCSVSGYGTEGPYQSKKAYDLLIQCETGVLAVTGSPDEPAKAGLSIADIAAGMYTYTGILTALYHRQTTGEGASLEVAMIDALGEWMSQPALLAGFSGTTPPRTGARHQTIAPYGPYECGDGQAVFLAVQNDREWASLCSTVLDRPELATDGRFIHNPDRVENTAALNVLVSEALQRSSSADVIEQLDQAGIANARMRTAAELLDHPALRERDRWRDVDTETGTARGLRSPVSIAGSDEVPLGSVPRLGEHNDLIRRELGVQV